jgi:hypothetical protein
MPIVKSCLHEACRRFFHAENPKQDYCLKKCSNQAGHTNRKKENFWENQKFKARKMIIKLIKKSIKNEIYEIPISLIDSIDPDCAYIPNKEMPNYTIRFGMYFLTVISMTTYRITLVD